MSYSIACRTSGNSATRGANLRQRHRSGIRLDLASGMSALERFSGPNELVPCFSGDQGAPTPVPERFMPDTAPDGLGFVGPVGVPPDPPALLLPKPTLGVKPDVTPGLDGVGLMPASPKWACCAKAALLVPAINKVESNRKCSQRMTSSFLFDGVSGPLEFRTRPLHY
jgi:hypothetical protein